MLDFEKLSDTLAEEFKEDENIEDVKDEEETKEEEAETESVDDANEIPEEDELDDPEIVEPVKAKKPTAEEKQAYAFEKLRKENAEAKKAKEALEKERKELEEIALAYGYRSHEEMLAALKEEKIKKEAAKNNMDPSIYKRVHESEERVKKLEAERANDLRMQKLNNFVNTFDKFLADNGLTETDKEDILISMEEDGYTLEDLVANKKPETLIKAYAVDKLKEKAVRDALVKKSAKEKLKETKLTDTGVSANAEDLDKLISDYIKKNANKNY